MAWSDFLHPLSKGLFSNSYKQQNYTKDFKDFLHI